MQSTEGWLSYIINGIIHSFVALLLHYKLKGDIEQPSYSCYTTESL